MTPTARALHRMPFGRHKGLPFGKIPASYVDWFLANVDGCDDIKEKMLAVAADALLRAAPPAPPKRPRVQSKKKRRPTGSPPRKGKRARRLAKRHARSLAGKDVKEFGERPEGWGQGAAEECPFD